MICKQQLQCSHCSANWTLLHHLSHRSLLDIEEQPLDLSVEAHARRFFFGNRQCQVQRRKVFLSDENWQVLHERKIRVNIGTQNIVLFNRSKGRLVSANQPRTSHPDNPQIFPFAAHKIRNCFEQLHLHRKRKTETWYTSSRTVSKTECGKLPVVGVKGMQSILAPFGTSIQRRDRNFI